MYNFLHFVNKEEFVYIPLIEITELHAKSINLYKLRILSYD